LLSRTRGCLGTASRLGLAFLLFPVQSLFQRGGAVQVLPQRCQRGLHVLVGRIQLCLAIGKLLGQFPHANPSGVCLFELHPVARQQVAGQFDPLDRRACIVAQQHLQDRQVDAPLVQLADSGSDAPVGGFGLPGKRIHVLLESPGLVVQRPDAAVVRFAGDSGDGMQLTGDRFTTQSAWPATTSATLPDFPAEIRAPAGTLAGVSSFQLHFSDQDIHTPGDAPDVLVAMNPAALMKHLEALKPGGTLIVNTDAFTDRNLQKAGYEGGPTRSRTAR
jgi:hypothetical protein